MLASMTPDTVSALRTSNTWVGNSQNNTPTKPSSLSNTTPALPLKQEAAVISSSEAEEISAPLGLWYDRYPTPTEASMAASETPAVDCSPSGTSSMTAGLGMGNDGHAEIFYGISNEMNGAMDGFQSTILPGGIDLSAAAAVNLIANDWMTPNSSSCGSGASSSVSMPMPGANSMANGYLSFDSILTDANGSFDTLPAVGEIHACLEATLNQNAMQKANLNTRGTMSAAMNTSAISYPRSVANLAIHGSAASDRTAKKAQLEETHQWLRDNFEPCHPKYSILRTKFYELYHNHARDINDPLEPMNQATFGKIIHQVFENVQTRRLGQRGHSKYHYSGVMPRRDSPLWADATDIIHCDPNYFVSDSRQRSQQQRQMQMAAAATGSSSSGSISIDSNMGTPKSYAESVSGYYCGETSRHSSEGSAEDDEMQSRGLHEEDDNEDEEESNRKDLLPSSMGCSIAFDGLTVCPSMLNKPADNGMTVEAVMASQLEELMASAANYNHEVNKVNVAPATQQLQLMPFMDPMDQMDMMRRQLLPWMPASFEATYSGIVSENADYYTVQRSKLCQILLQEYAKQCRAVMIHVLQNELNLISEKMHCFWSTVNHTLKDLLHFPALWHDIVEADRTWYLACDRQYHENPAYRAVLGRFFDEAPRWVNEVVNLMPEGLSKLRLTMVGRFYQRYQCIKLGRQDLVINE